MRRETKATKQKTLEQRVLRFFREHKLTSREQKLVIAVSGGPDSVCLLQILFKLQNELGICLHVAHLDHQLRGDESRADARYVADLAHHLNIPATIEQRDVAAYQAQRHISLEEAAREVRYTFLSRVAESVGTDRAAVGHTADDHTETLLMHLIRGSGTRGLRGLQPSNLWQSSGNSLTVLRPLLQISREETADYCHQHNIMTCLDTSNLSLSPLRNRIRHQLMPLLRSYNPRVAEALFRTAQIATDDLAFLDEEAGRLWSIIARKQDDTITFDKEKLCQLPPALMRHLLRASIEKLAGNLTDIEARHIEEIMDALDKPAGKRIILPAGLTFSIEYDRYLLGSDPAALSPFPVLETEAILNIPGKTRLAGWNIEAEIIAPALMMKNNDEFSAYFDLDIVGDEITMRRRRPGDRFQPLGMSHPKKLNVFMIDSKIPHAWRQRVPIICTKEQILWVAGYRIDERAKVTANTRMVLSLKMQKIK